MKPIICFFIFFFTASALLHATTAATRPYTYDIFSLQSYDSEQLGAIRRGSRVEHLPGQPPLHQIPSPSFLQYSGYIGVNQPHGRALFYWFIQAPSPLSLSKPLVLWLNGGPGCSSIGYGAAQELGPFRVNKDGSGLIFNQYAWNQEANMLFLDSPVGVGFSYSNDSTDLHNYGDKLTAHEAYKFLINWFKIFPEFMSHDFYLTGESYAGHYVPQLANLIHDLNNLSMKHPRINLKGFMVGNPTTDDYYDWVGIIDYAWSHAIISDQLYIDITKTCDFSKVNWTSSCADQVSKVFAEYRKIDIYNLYEPICTSNTSNRAQLNSNKHGSLSGSQQGRPFYPSGYDPCLEEHTIRYFNNPQVQEALHANVSGTIPYAWTVCSDVLFQNWRDSDFSILPIYKKLIHAGLRIWVYRLVDGRRSSKA